MNTEMRLELLKIFQDTTSRLATETGLDPTDRLLMMEVIAARLRSDDKVGATASSIQRSTGISYETVRRRIRALEDRNFIRQAATGLDVANSEIIDDLYADVMDEFISRLAPLVKHMDPAT